MDWKSSKIDYTAAPVISLQGRNGFSHLAGEPGQIKIHQFLNILFSLSERRNRDIKEVQTIVEV